MDEDHLNNLCWPITVIVEHEIDKILQREPKFNRAEILMMLIKMISVGWPDPSDAAPREPSTGEN